MEVRHGTRISHLRRGEFCPVKRARQRSLPMQVSERRDDFKPKTGFFEAKRAKNGSKTGQNQPFFLAGKLMNIICKLFINRLLLPSVGI
jgi:hypothetical protein